MLSTHLRLGLPSGLFLSGFPTKTLYYDAIQSENKFSFSLHRAVPFLKYNPKYHTPYGLRHTSLKNGPRHKEIKPWVSFSST